MLRFSFMKKEKRNAYNKVDEVFFFSFGFWLSLEINQRY